MRYHLGSVFRRIVECYSIDLINTGLASVLHSGNQKTNQRLFLNL